MWSQSAPIGVSGQHHKARIMCAARHSFSASSWGRRNLEVSSSAAQFSSLADPYIEARISDLSVDGWAQSRCESVLATGCVQCCPLRHAKAQRASSALGGLSRGLGVALAASALPRGVVFVMATVKTRQRPGAHPWWVVGVLAHAFASTEGRSWPPTQSLTPPSWRWSPYCTPTYKRGPGGWPRPYPHSKTRPRRAPGHRQILCDGRRWSGGTSATPYRAMLAPLQTLFLWGQPIPPTKNLTVVFQTAESDSQATNRFRGHQGLDDE